MEQLIINIENKSILPHLKKILNAIDGISIVKPNESKQECGLDEAINDVREGRVHQAKNADDMFKQILGI